MQLDKHNIPACDASPLLHSIKLFFDKVDLHEDPSSVVATSEFETLVVLTTVHWEALVRDLSRL